MGQLCFTPSTPQTRIIDTHMDEEFARDRQTTKLLLLGTGNAGKSTFFRQFQMLYGDGISEEERRNYLEQVQQQCVDQMKLLAAGCLYRAQQGHNDLELSPAADEAYRALCRETDKNNPLDESTTEYIRTLWDDPGIKNGFDLRAKLCVAETSHFFWDEIERIGAVTYMPTNADIVLLRAPTNGITAVDFLIEGQSFQIVDVGGQRSERKKWFNVFDNVTGILWVASLSAYDEVLFEDHSANAMLEQLGVFQETINLKCFAKTPIILFLNKSDLFQAKLPRSALNECFEDFDGGDDYNLAIRHLKVVFKGQNAFAARDIYVHVTCATNTDSVERVFSDVTHTVVHRSLADARIL